MSKEIVTVGKLGRTRGLEGELYIIPLTDFPERFLNLNEIYLRKKDSWEMVQIVSTRFVSGRLVIKFKNINTREDASRLTNQDIAVPDDQLVELPDDTFYIFDLIGCNVIEEGSEKVLGKIINVEQYPANDVYVIKTIKEKEILFPAVKKFVKNIDIKNKKVTILTAGIIDDI
ncbi:MAG: ribosome maturation factor RimM [Candidatus Zixiibacteriota bacterium]